MNERITIVSDVEISVQRNDSEFSRTRMKLTAGTLDIRQSIDVGSWDALGQAALIEALNCLRDAKNFAALSDESAVPYVGKRMRVSGEIGIYEVSEIIGNGNYDMRDINNRDGLVCERSELLPLTPPAPKARVRPFTPVEAAAHLGRELKYDVPVMRYKLRSVSETDVRFQSDHNAVSIWLTYSDFAQQYKWADDNSPCGVEVTEGGA